MKNDFRGLIVGWVEPIYVKLKEVGKLAVRHFKGGRGYVWWVWYGMVVLD